MNLDYELQDNSRSILKFYSFKKQVVKNIKQ